MNNAEAVNWLINITADIGKIEHQELWHYEQALSEIREMLENAPTIEPQRKKGHWIRHPEQRNIFNSKTIECSECHEKYTVQYVEDEWFCRHCGADMREDGEADVDAES